LADWSNQGDNQVALALLSREIVYGGIADNRDVHPGSPFLAGHGKNFCPESFKQDGILVDDPTMALAVARIP
jgi:hypothetical protein